MASVGSATLLRSAVKRLNTSALSQLSSSGRVCSRTYQTRTHQSSWKTFRRDASKKEGSSGKGEKRELQFTGPVLWRGLGLMTVAGSLTIAYYYYEKANRQVELAVKVKEGAGRPKLGGPFTLIDQHGKTRTDKDFHGKWVFLYFGFTHCPDICPDELEKQMEVINSLDKRVGEVVQPLFITVDPNRDSVEKVREYTKEWHPRLVALTGDIESIGNVCKSYRVYYSKGDELEGDYLVDHSIIHYLIDPEGKFVSFFGKNTPAESVVDRICEYIAAYERQAKEEK